MIDIAAWTDRLLPLLSEAFGDRVWFVGLQGSYARGEATETSDIDIVLILDELSPADIRTYHEILEQLPHRELACGFLSGKSELLHWEPSDLFQFYYDTKPLYGSLDALRPLVGADAAKGAIRIGVCNIYHGCVHNMLHEKSADVLKGLYKSAAFVVQAIVFSETGTYIGSLRELLSVASPDECAVIDTCLRIKGGAPINFESLSEALLAWSKAWIIKES